MQGLPKHIRDPGDILGVGDETTLEDLRRAYDEARTRAAGGTSLEELGAAAGPAERAEGGGPRATLRDVEWAYKELLARFLTSGTTAATASGDEDAAVAAVLLPGLSEGALRALSEQSNVVAFAARREAQGLSNATGPTGVPGAVGPVAAVIAAGASGSHTAFAEDEDFTPLPYAGIGTLLPNERAHAPVDAEGFGIPELREALERAAAPVRKSREPAPSVVVGPSDRLVPNGAITTTRASHAPSSRHAAARPSPATEWERDAIRRRADAGALPGSAHARPLAPGDSPLSRAVTGPLIPPKTIRTVIGGEERLVVSVVAPSAQGSGISDRLKAVVASADTATGALLRTLRLEAGIDEREICLRIRVPLDQLAALEEDAFDRLPAPVYYRGFVMSYLKYLGVERPDLADALTANYRAQLRGRHQRGSR